MKTGSRSSCHEKTVERLAKSPGTSVDPRVPRGSCFLSGLDQSFRMASTVAIPATGFHTATRIQEALTATIERQALLWLARRTPDRISPDHLTALGFAAQFLAGISYALARWNKAALLLATFFIALNWLGDSLDGTLARFRQRLRPRYGFYVDHMSDTFGAVFLMTGLAASGYLHWQIAAGMLVAFLVLSVESYLTTYTLARFTMSHAFFGPTEIRILLMIGNIVLIFRPYAHLLGQRFLLFDVGGVIAICGMFGMAIVAAVRHTATLYRQERFCTKVVPQPTAHQPRSGAIH
jgi:archaetidylinositol phosphate synthase